MLKPQDQSHIAHQARSCYARIIANIKYVAWLVISLCFILGLSLILIDQAIGFYVRSQIYTDINQLPKRPYGVVFGTAKYVAKNKPNLYYQYRLQAANALFKQNKVDYLLLSGDNRTAQYNEPRNMYQDLRKMGIGNEFLYMDYAGFRTLDSVIRANQVFQAHSVTLITQRFHCERALFIANYYHIDAICYAAQSPKLHYSLRIREFFARLLLIWDLISQKAPHFLGDPEPLPAPIEP